VPQSDIQFCSNQHPDYTSYLGIDFLQQHHTTSNFADTPVQISVISNAAIVGSDPTLRRVLEEAECDL